METKPTKVSKTIDDIFQLFSDPATRIKKLNSVIIAHAIKQFFDDE